MEYEALKWTGALLYYQNSREIDYIYYTGGIIAF